LVAHIVAEDVTAQAAKGLVTRIFKIGLDVGCGDNRIFILPDLV